MVATQLVSVRLALKWVIILGKAMLTIVLSKVPINIAMVNPIKLIILVAFDIYQALLSVTNGYKGNICYLYLRLLV